MSDYKKYQHLEKFGSQEVEGILTGDCYIFPKIDGTNAQVWFDGDRVRCGSRRREITPENDNAGFAAWVNGESTEALDVVELAELLRVAEFSASGSCLIHSRPTAKALGVNSTFLILCEVMEVTCNMI